MEELQQFFTQLVSNISTLIPLGYAFGAGMVSAVNPCGFAMLPAYLGLYLGTRELSATSAGGGSTYGVDSIVVTVPAQMARGVLVTLVVTAGVRCPLRRGRRRDHRRRPVCRNGRFPGWLWP